MSVLSIVLWSVVGFLVYVQIGRWLGWWSYRTLQKHLRYKKTIYQYRVSLDEDPPQETVFTALKQSPGMDMRILFPFLCLDWKKEGEEVISSGPLLDILHSGSKESVDVYRWLMIVFWPLKVIGCLVALIFIGALMSARLGARFLRWSYRLLFTWPERKTAAAKPQDAQKPVSQEHGPN